jgi:hypothetical protein
MHCLDSWRYYGVVLIYNYKCYYTKDNVLAQIQMYEWITIYPSTRYLCVYFVPGSRKQGHNYKQRSNWKILLTLKDYLRSIYPSTLLNIFTWCLYITWNNHFLWPKNPASPSFPISSHSYFQLSKAGNKQKDSPLIILFFILYYPIH